MLSDAAHDLGEHVHGLQSVGQRIRPQPVVCSYSGQELGTASKTVQTPHLHDGFPALPASPLRAFERPTAVSAQGGRWGRGQIAASVDVRRYDWAFACHFEDDPILPGVLLVDAMLQLVGHFAGVIGYRGRGRAVRIGKTRFTSEVLPSAKQISYVLDIRRTHKASQTVVASGEAFSDGVICASSDDLWVKILH